MTQTAYSFFAPAPRGIAPLLAQELRQLGAGEVTESRAGAAFTGPLEAAYRACLWSRLASRVLLTLGEVDGATGDALYDGLRDMPWLEHMDPSGTLAVSFNGTSAGIVNSHFGALRAKDAVVDYFRDTCGTRPSVDLENPSLRLNVHLHRGRATVSLDLSGQALHRRGYRVESVEAPLKENLAAAVLVRAGWPEVAAAGGPLVDLMCGSGTLLIEAAWMAVDRAPALDRQDLALLRWPRHDAALWDGLVREARERLARGLERLPSIRGFDSDAAAVKASWANLERAGLTGLRGPGGAGVHVERRAVESGPLPSDAPSGIPGLVVANPPYGQRLGNQSTLRALYAQLAMQMRSRFAGWRAAVLVGDPEWAPSLGLGPGHVLYNGSLECRLVTAPVPAAPASDGPAASASPEPEAPGRRGDPSRADRPPAARSRGAGPGGGRSSGAPAPGTLSSSALTPGAEMLANRLRKNLRTLGKWARRNDITCYRLYDADMPEYALAFDLYQGERLWVHAQEYRAPATVDPAKAATRLQEALSAVQYALEIPPDQVFYKMRERQKGAAQYRRLDQTGEFYAVQEGPCSFLVNFTDYLDTGLFLDHRPTRALIRELAPERRFLNLFAYTATATVHAAAGGAAATTSVDLSAPSLEWARRNLERNGCRRHAHSLVQADCLEWLRANERERYDLIFLDPPTFSNSKRMVSSFDVQRDHGDLIERTSRLLKRDGVLLFSTNAQRFKLETDHLTDLVFEDISRDTIARDFERNPRIHQCWRITWRP